MTSSVLIAYASKHGSTREVAQAVAETLDQHGVTVDVLPAREVHDLDGYDGVVLGSAIYMGRVHEDARRFLSKHRSGLADVPFAVFAMGPTSLRECELAASLGQLQKALETIPDVQPVAKTIFGGVVDPAKLRFPFNRMPAADARDWNAIRAWAETVAVRFERAETLVRT